MNKFRWSMVGLITAAAVISVVMTIYQNAKSYEERREARSTPVEILNKDDEEAEMEEQTAAIGGVQESTGLSPTSTQDEVIEVMHHMTHQKVISEDKWGSVEMNSENINEVYEIVKDSDFSLKRHLLRIVSGWKEGSFENVDQDHNFFWEYQGGTVGKATGVLNSDEEAEFIDNNF